MHPQQNEAKQTVFIFRVIYCTPIGRLYDLRRISQSVYMCIFQFFWEFHLFYFCILIIQLGHKFAHATTARLSWHVQSCGLICSLAFMSERYILLKDLNYELINPLWKGPHGALVSWSRGPFTFSITGKFCGHVFNGKEMWVKVAKHTTRNYS